MAITLTHSVEYLQNVLTDIYQHYLDRTPDAPGLHYWVQTMQSGTSDQQVEASFLGSREYIADHGGTGAAWVQGMYHDLLGRNPDSQGLAYWEQQLNQGASPQAVALGFAASPERAGQHIATDYWTYLGRAASPQEVNYWVGQFRQGTSNEMLVANFISAPEYYQQQHRGGGTAADWVSSAYRDVFHRVAAPGDIQYWSDVIE